MSFADDFGPFEGKTWINCAHQGALPRVAAEAAREAIAWKVAPHHMMPSERFSEVPARLRRALSQLLSAPENEILLANSASYGLHLIANGYPWRSGDAVLLVRRDFPSVVLPWLGLQNRGVDVQWIEPGPEGVTPEDLERHIDSSTKVFCTTWVHSFTGRALDLNALGDVCRRRGVRFVVNGAQALGARPIDVKQTPIDALTSVGFKWLCGPYGTGLCWLEPELCASLELNQAYWLTVQTADDLGKETDLPEMRDDLGARRYDVFGTANFFNFKPWTAAVEYLLAQGIARIEAHDQKLVDQIVEGLFYLGYDVLSPRDGGARSTLVIASHRDRERNPGIQKTLMDDDIFLALRRGNLRLSPHLFNTEQDIDRALEALARAR